MYTKFCSRVVVCTEEGSVSVCGRHEKRLLRLDSLTVRSPVSRMRLHPSRLECVVGGKENDLMVWDLEAKKKLWEAKNVRNGC